LTLEYNECIIYTYLEIKYGTDDNKRGI
jgi:hypothetical protein